MIRFTHSTLPCVAVLCLGACGGRAPAPPVPAPADPAAQVQRLGRIVENYWDDNAALMPWYSWGSYGENIAPQTLADSLALERRSLLAALAIPRSALDTEAQLTFDIFRRERALAVEGFTFPFELLPVDPYDAMPQQFAIMAAGAERLAVLGPKGYEDWRNRAGSFVSWTHQAIQNLRDGMRRGYTLPRALVEKTLPQLAALGRDTQDNIFYRPLRSGDEARQAPSTAAVATTVKEQILPAYRSLHDFLQNEYLPRARTTVGWSALPLGTAWYAYLAKRATGGTLAPAQLHALGLAELDRLHARAQSLLAAASATGGAQAYVDDMRHSPKFSFENADALLRAVAELKAQVGAAAPTAFAGIPRAEMSIRSVEDFRQPVTPFLSYRPRAPNGLLAAVLYVNTAHPESRSAPLLAAQYLREAVPGHHFQLELQHERSDLPRFRRFGGAPAFVEGWGLYASSLGEELGLDHEPEAKFAALLEEMNCAAGMVIDTGLHSLGWSRQQALDFMHARVPMADDVAADTVDRSIARPADALACTVGYLKFVALRTLAQQKLGARFDLRAFLTELVRDGAMPMDLLESKMQSWMEAGPAAPSVPADASAAEDRPASSAWR